LYICCWRIAFRKALAWDIAYLPFSDAPILRFHASRINCGT
jgi:hypothetical protein